MSHTFLKKQEPRAKLMLPAFLFFCFALFQCSTGEAGTAAAPKHEYTNVIMISIDTLRADHLGCYGYSRNTSENIDKLAKHSALFDNFISQAVLTPISQMSIFTSQYPRVNGMTSFEAGLDTVTQRTLPDILKLYGYTNAAFISSPEFLQSRNVRNLADSKNHGKIFGRSFDVYQGRGNREIQEEALQWIESNKEKKFFLWLPIGTVHWPYSGSIPATYRNKFDPKDYTPFFSTQPTQGRGRGKDDSVSLDVLSLIYHNNYYGNPFTPYPLSARDIEYIISRYDAGINYTDIFVGKVLSLLDQLNITNNTLIILHSIHGEDLGEHGYYYHYDCHDTETKNALIIRFPFRKFGGQRLSPQTQGIDVVPTILDYLGIPSDHNAQGISLMPLITTGQPNTQSEFAYIDRIPLWEYLSFVKNQILGVSITLSKASPAEVERRQTYIELLRQRFNSYSRERPPHDIAIRTNQWKLILRRDSALLQDISWWAFLSGRTIRINEVELYDLRSDPMELVDISASRPDVVATLKSKLLEWDKSCDSVRATSHPDSDRFLIPYP